jgi:hypothetical protein
MVDRFRQYEKCESRAKVEKCVLFGDCFDVQSKNAVLRDPPTSHPGDGGSGYPSTINYELKPSSDAVPGMYQHGKIHFKETEEESGRFVHIIHHEDCNGESLGKYLCSVRGYQCGPNVYGRYDWCHGRNWGTNRYGDDPEEDERDFHDLGKHYFVTVSQEGKEISRIELSTDCIEGDWHRGVKLVDRETDCAFCFMFGDAFENDEDEWVDGLPDEDTDFVCAMEDFTGKSSVVVNEDCTPKAKKMKTTAQDKNVDDTAKKMKTTTHDKENLDDAQAREIEK